MRLDRLILTGLSDAFPGVVDLPLRDIGDGVVAIVGPNGEGKTTILEATPGAVYRKLPSRDDVDPVEYAKGRESSIDLTFSFDGIGAFRSRLNLDGPKRKSDAVLEQILADGARHPLNDGKVSTYDAAVKARFPSFDLFINSSYAAQGRGDEFTKSKPSARKDLFAEFLDLRRLFDLAKTAAAAADLVSDARLRLEVQGESLTCDTEPWLAAELDELANRLQTTGGTAELRQQQLRETLATLEARAAVAQDQVAAYAAATHRVATLANDRAVRQAERGAITSQRAAAQTTIGHEQARIIAKRQADVKEITKRIDGNQQLLGMADQIRAAVTAVADAEVELSELRAELSERQAERQQADAAVREVERAIAVLVPVEQRLDRSTRDAGLLGSVPCGGTGEYAACQFLVNATHAQAQIEDLKATLAPKAALADQLASRLKHVNLLELKVTAVSGRISGLDTAVAKHTPLTKYSAPLLEATTKITGYQAAKEKAEADANTQILEAIQRHADRDAELEDHGCRLDETIDRLTRELATAKTDLEGAAAGNQHAIVLQAELATTRADWDTVTTTLATVASGRQDLERRRQDLQAKRERLVDVRDRLARVDRELLEWRDLARALGKGGLPDLEIDAAGPTITATTNELLSACFGPRFTLELVTQVAKADGDGMKDLFTVLVLDNEAPARGWKDLKFLSGGQKVVVQEALMCAIAVYVNARAVMPIRTLWRDETGAALDPENAVRYVQMLRRVRELGGFHQVYFITHNTEAAALVDVQIRVGGGHATIVYPPFITEAA